MTNTMERTAASFAPPEVATPYVTVHRSLDDERARLERELEDAGIVLPLSQQARWAEARGFSGSWLFVARAGDGTPVGAFAAALTPSNLPGHVLLRVPYYAGMPDAASSDAALAALATAARRDRRVLRVYLELCSPDPRVHEWTAAAAARAGFVTAPEPHSYDRTLVADLTPDEETVFSRLSSSARRNVRALRKHPLELRVLTDVALVERMHAIMRETMERTGGSYQPVDWHAVLAMSARHPDRLRAVGLFHTEVAGPDALVAFMVGHHQGRYVTYFEGASTRATTLKAPLAYPLLWDLMSWAKQRGAAWFDFGGVTAGSSESDDPLGGISDFKRFFGGQVMRVGAEWVLEPHPASVALLRLVRAGRALASRLTARH